MTPIYYLTVLYVRSPGWLSRFLCSGFHMLKSTCWPCWALIGRLWKESPSKLIQVVGRIQFTVVIGLRTRFLAAAQLRAALSSWRPFSDPSLWAPTSQSQQRHTESFPCLKLFCFSLLPHLCASSQRTFSALKGLRD